MMPTVIKNLCAAAVIALCLLQPCTGAAAPLHDALDQGDLSGARQLINSGTDLNAKDAQQRTPMDVAASKGYAEIVKLLLDKGVNVYAAGANKGEYDLNAPLYLAAIGGHLEVVKLLARKPAGAKGQPELNGLLRIAVNYGREGLAQWALEQGADANSDEPGAAQQAPAPRKPVGPSLLSIASSRGQPKVVSLLMAHGAKANPGENEQLIMLGWAAYEGKADVIRKLLPKRAGAGKAGTESPEEGEGEGEGAAAGLNVDACIAGDEDYECTRALDLAIRNGKVNTAQLLIDSGAAVGPSNLGEAICARSLKLVKLLGASGDNRNYALAQTVACGNKEILAYLMGKTPVDYAAVAAQLAGRYQNYAHADQYEAHLAADAQPDTALFEILFAGDREFKSHTDGLLGAALCSGSDRLAALLYARGVELKKEVANDALLRTAPDGYYESVKLLLDHGVKPDPRSELGNTPLLRAVPFGRTEVAALLLQHGADVNAKNELYNTPLHLAAARDMADMAALLIKNGARVNAINGDGNTPLHQAVRLARGSNVLKLLLESKAKVNIQNKIGMTALHYLAIRNTDYWKGELAGNQPGYGYMMGQAAEPWQMQSSGIREGVSEISDAERMNAVKLLVANGADLNIKNDKGESPLDLERRYAKNRDFVRFLESQAGKAKR